MRSIPKVLLGLFLLTIASLPSAAYVLELRGTVSSVEAGGRLRIDLPGGAVAMPGDEVRIETVIPGIGPVEIKSRWRVALVGEGFVIADPQGKVSGTPQAGYTAIVISAQSAPAASRPAAKAAEDEGLVVPALKLSGEQLAGLQNQVQAGDVQAMLLLATYHEGGADPSDSVPRRPDEALRLYEMASGTGDVGAMRSLGLIHLTQREDDKGAARWLGKAADQGDASAMHMLGGLYAQGRGVPEDPVRSFEWIWKAAEAGSDLAILELAGMYLNGDRTSQDDVEAAHWYRKAADQGFASAMVQLARLYTDGKGVARDPERGFEWSLKAAQAGSPLAMHQVGTYYLQAPGKAGNPAEARRWLERAADAGEAEAMFSLSYIHDSGLGVAPDPGTAADWMIRAIRAGSFQAAENVMRTQWKWSPAFHRELQRRLREAGVYEGRIDGDIGPGSRRAIAALSAAGQSGRPEIGLAVTEARASECDRLAAHPHDDEAVAPGVAYAELDAAAVIAACQAAVDEDPDTLRFQAQLGRGLYKAGRPAEALGVWDAAAESGNALSMAFIGVMFKIGQAVRPDPAEALRWFEMAAEKGNTGAMVFAAGMHFAGQGTAKNNGRAVHWYEKAAARGVAEAMSSLGIMYGGAWVCRRIMQGRRTSCSVPFAAATPRRNVS